MGCGSSQEAAPQQNANIDRNGEVKRESPPPRQNEHSQNKPQPNEIKQDSPKEKRKDSAKSKSSSSSSSRSSSAQSKKSRPETAPGGNIPPVPNEEPAKNNTIQQQDVQQQSAEVIQDNNNANSEKPRETPTNEPNEEPARAEVEEAPDETTTQGAVVVAEASSNQEQEKPNFSEAVLTEFVEVENQIKSLEEKGAVNNYQIKHTRLLELHKNLTASQDKVEKLKAQT